MIKKNLKIIKLLIIVVLCAGIAGFVGVAAAQSSGFENANPIDEGTTTGEIVDGSTDFYEFTANTTDALDTKLTAESGDLEFRVYDPNGEELVSDGFVNAGSTSQLTIKAPETGTYYIEVSGNDEQTTSDYSLDLDVVTPSENDGFAPNDDFDSAAQLDEGFSDATIWGGESDFYEFTANTTDALDIRLTPDARDLEFRIYDPSREVLVSDTYVSSGSTGRLTIKAPETGTYYVEVTGDDEQTTTDYTINHDIVTPSENDDYAPNDDFDSAAQLDEGFTGATIWGGESDFYEFTANTTDALDIRLTPDTRDLEFRIYDPSREVLVSDTYVSSGSTGRLTIKAPETGTYYVEVTGDDEQTTTDYTINHDIVTPSENDDYAPNDDFDSAASITAEFTDAKLWGGESDYYRVGLNDSEGVNIALTPESQDMELYVYGPDGEQLTSDTYIPSGSSNSLSIQAEQTGNHYIEIAGDDQMTTSEYQLGSNRTGSFDVSEPFDFGIELQSEATVQTGNSVTISTYPNNNADEPVSDTIVELLVDSNNDGQFDAQEVVVSTSADFDAGEYREITLTYENVQLDAGDYTYRAQISKDDQTTTSFSDGTLTVTADTGSSVSDYADGNGVVDTSGLRTAINDWRAGDINTGLLREVITAWRNT